jgi:hypothetical protein
MCRDQARFQKRRLQTPGSLPAIRAFYFCHKMAKERVLRQLKRFRQVYEPRNFPPHLMLIEVDLEAPETGP